MLFSNIQRSDTDPQSHSKTDYTYLDSSARVEAECIRNILTDWFLRYPDDHNRTDLVARFKSSRNLQHISASFELYLHELFLQLGYSVRVHPPTPSDKGTSPDFLLTDKEGNKFYLEAVQVTDVDDKERGANKRMKVLFDEINKIKSNNFSLSIQYSEIPDTQPAGKKIRDKLSQWLDTLDVNDVIQHANADESNLPEYEISCGGCILKFTASPRTPGKRGEPIDRILCMQMPGVRWLSTSEEIRNSLRTKGKHYGNLDAPLVIAVNANVLTLDKIDIMEALFGQEQLIFHPNNRNREPKMERLNNGFWCAEGGTRYTRASSVLIGFDINPWKFAVRELTLYENPWAKEPICGSVKNLPRAILLNGKMKWTGGKAPKDILNLPRIYPGTK